MTVNNRWLLPEGIEEVLPPRAMQLEKLSRELIDLFDSWGYDLVMPPLIEYLESLLIGTGKDLDLQTFKITDQLNGKTMGVRADTTPQVARIDSHTLKRDYPTRLCYLATVLHTRPNENGGARSPLQLGAELYGHQGTASDIEVISLMLETLQKAGVANISLDLGHVAMYRKIIETIGLDAIQQENLFDILQRKAASELKAKIQSWELNGVIAKQLEDLLHLHGGIGVLETARDSFSNHSELAAYIEEVETVVSAINERYPDIPINIDFAELRGYNYHTGLVFTAYTLEQGKAIALGGRYDNIGEDFGNARPATGFSTCLKTILSISQSSPRAQELIFAPAESDEALQELIKQLREEGKRVIVELAGQDADAVQMQCTHKIKKQDKQWFVESI